MSWQTGSVARSQSTTMDMSESAIRLLTDNGYVVLKAPTWPAHLPVEAVRWPATIILSGRVASRMNVTQGLVVAERHFFSFHIL